MTTSFRPTFSTPFEQHSAREGELFTVLREITEPDDDHDAEVLPMYRIRFADGVEIEAWPEEVTDVADGTLAERLAESFDLESKYLMSFYGEAQGTYRITEEQYHARFKALALPESLMDGEAVNSRTLKAAPDDFARMARDDDLCRQIVAEWRAENGEPLTGPCPFGESAICTNRAHWGLAVRYGAR